MADRTYSKAFEINRAAPAFLYIEDPTLNAGSGGWRPYRTTDAGGGGGTISGDINISGIGQLILETDALEELAASGNAYLAPALKSFTNGFSNRLLAKPSAGTLFGVNGYNNNTGIQYLHVYDNVNSGSNLINVIAVDAQNNFSVDFGSKGIQMNSGIFVCNSTTPAVLNNGANDLFLTISYK